MKTATIRLIEAVQARTERRTLYAVAKALGISTQRVYAYVHNGTEIVDDDLIVRAAIFAGLDPSETLAQFQAEKSRTPNARAAWKKLVELARMSAAALLVWGAITAPLALHSPSVNASESDPFIQCASYLMYWL